MKIETINSLIKLEIQIKNLNSIIGSSLVSLTIWADKGGIQDRDSLFTGTEVKARAEQKLKEVMQEKNQIIESLSDTEKQTLEQILKNDPAVQMNSFV